MFFELDDIKRRHSLYFDVYNVNGWVRTPDSNASWLFQRGAMIGVTAKLLNEFTVSFTENWKLLGRHYQPPANVQQFGIYVREIFKMDQFKKMMKTRSQYAFSMGVTDVAARVAVFRYANNGWQKPFGGFEYAFMRKLPGSVLAALVTAPLSIPLELARMAYYADKTFPVELQKGYTSYFNALRRIPFEEGPYYLFKNSSPIFLKNFFQTFTMFYTFDFVKDKASAFWRVGEMPYFPCKVAIAAFSAYLACAFSYPWAVTIREMVDFWPKEKGGVCTWDNNYRKAAVWLYYHDNSTNYYPGFFKNYFFRQFPWIFTTLYLSDSLGIFSYWQVDYYSGAGTNSWEDSFS